VEEIAITTNTNIGSVKSTPPRNASAERGPFSKADGDEQRDAPDPDTASTSPSSGAAPPRAVGSRAALLHHPPAQSMRGLEELGRGETCAGSRGRRSPSRRRSSAPAVPSERARPAARGPLSVYPSNGGWEGAPPGGAAAIATAGQVEAASNTASPSAAAARRSPRRPSWPSRRWSEALPIATCSSIFAKQSWAQGPISPRRWTARTTCAEACMTQLLIPCLDLALTPSPARAGLRTNARARVTMRTHMSAEPTSPEESPAPGVLRVPEELAGAGEVLRFAQRLRLPRPLLIKFAGLRRHVQRLVRADGRHGNLLL